MKIAKKILSIVVDTFIVIVFLIAVVTTIGAINQSKSGVNSAFGLTLNTVQSDSMTGTFEKGDLIVGKVYDVGDELNVDDIITFRQTVNGQVIINTHRIVGKTTVSGVECYYTQGDKIGAPQDDLYRTPSEILAVYSFKIGGIGSFIDWLNEPVGFILCIITPIVAAIVYQAYVIISILLKNKKEQALEAASAPMTDEMKGAIIQEYLAQLAKAGITPPVVPDVPQEASTAENATAAEKPSATAEENIEKADTTVND